jgi:DNA-binding MarR family transcriptional regulator
MPGAAFPDDKSTRKLVLDMFTEIAILEHLIRKRLEPLETGGLTAQQFGVVNYFSRLGKTEEKISTIAWCFQVDIEYMRETVDFLVAEGLLSIDQANDPCVRLTDAGRAHHDETVSSMAPEVLPLLEEFDIEDLRTTTRVLMELRRTMDNLPDR